MASARTLTDGYSPRMAQPPALDFQMSLTLVALQNALEEAKRQPRRRIMRVYTEEVVDALMPGADAKRKAASMPATRYALLDLERAELVTRETKAYNRAVTWATTELGRAAAEQARRVSAGSTSPRQMQRDQQREAAERTRDQLREQITETITQIAAVAETATTAAELRADDGRTIAGPLEDLLAHLSAALAVIQETAPE